VSRAGSTHETPNFNVRIAQNPTWAAWVSVPDQTSTGELTALPDPLAGFTGLTSKVRGKWEREEKGREEKRRGSVGEDKRPPTQILNWFRVWKCRF